MIDGLIRWSIRARAAVLGLSLLLLLISRLTG